MRNVPDPLSKAEVAKQVTLFVALISADVIILCYLAVHLAIIWTGVVLDASWLIRYASAVGCVFLLLQMALRVEPLFDRERQLTDRIIALILLPLTLAGVVAVVTTLQEFNDFLSQTSLLIHPSLGLSLYGKVTASMGILLMLAVPIFYLRNILHDLDKYHGRLVNERLRRNRDY